MRQRPRPTWTVIERAPLARPMGAIMSAMMMGLGNGAAMAETAASGLYTLQTPQRLSAWLDAQGHALQGTEPLGLGWGTPEERQRQTLQRQADVAWLRHGLRKPAESALWQWLRQSPVTGRRVLSAAVAPWLEGVPARDPLLRPGDEVWTRPAQGPVHVLDGSGGQGCRLPHQSTAWLADYVAACPSLLAGVRPARAWAVQPDGQVKAYSLQAWQPEPQTRLAPGAVVWLGWPRELLQPEVTETELDHLNHRTAEWLALARPDDLQALPTVERPQAWAVGLPTDERLDWSGLQGARFSPESTASQWGVVGLMQTPTARMRPAGSFSFSLMNTPPYTWMNVVMQPLDWLEGGFRYQSVSNQLYGPVEFSGSQSYKDKSFELKARLARETTWRPELALGIRDLGGTGLFAGEYLVASKRWGRFDASLGLGWGNLGARGNLSNPLSVLGRRFEQRETDVGNGGTVSTGVFFRGRTALFGGLEYQSPWGPVFKVEYNGNDYRSEPFGNRQSVQSPLNFGMVYRWVPGVDLHAGLERGNTLSVGLSLWTDLSRLNTPKVSDRPLPAVSLVPPRAAPDWRRTAADLEAWTNWQVRQLVQEGPTLGVVVDQSYGTYLEPRLERVMRVVQRDAPAEVQQVEVRHWAAGDVLAVDRMDRAQWTQPLVEPSRTAEPPPLSVREWPQAHAYTGPQVHSAPLVLHARADKPWDLYPSMSFKQSLGGPDAFMLYKLSLTLAGQVRLPLDWQLHGLAEWRALSNYDRFRFRGFGTDLPRVRTFLREYETESRLTLPRLYAVRSARWSERWTGAVYAGLLESMYAGAGGEVLYRPPGSPLAVGLDVNRVQQRDFAQDFGLRDYKVNTGHLTTYWETPWQGLVAVASVGQYLAGDRGVTLMLSRTFSNGTSMGAFATKTNISAAQFGEGSFNKGVFWSIPFDAFMTSSSRLRANFNWIPLTRDGGAMLARPHALYGETAHLSPRATEWRPAPARQKIPDDLR